MSARFAYSLAFFVGLSGSLPGQASEWPRTEAEKSDYQSTSTYEQVRSFCNELAKKSTLVRQASLGKSHEGRELPALFLASPPVATPAEAAKSGRLVIVAMANIHAGEVDGKEALLMLARD